MASRRFQDAEEFSDYIKLLEDLAHVEQERTPDISTAINRLRALNAEHVRIVDERARLARRMKEFEQGCRAALFMVASIAMSR
jgi:hypothetical protein